MNVIRTRPAGRRPRQAAEAAQATVAESVSSPELRELIARMPLWRRPGYLVRRLHQLHNALFFSECEGFDITPVQYGVLTTLSLLPGSDQNTLAQEVGLDRTNVADVLVRLERRGLVRRQRGEADRRTVLAWLTADGEALLKAMYAVMRRSQERLLAPLAPAEREQFLGMLLRLIDAHNQHGRAALGRAAE
ncbi:MarR family transcriptional regulator [Roseomonas sp. NAR14]|uniref:MarR family transcriptional regulator n=1 Tax=Roseomonas acroporae TaxID=2937791 RepID=A0A9X2BWI3_9PROT|nr:MarR family transcriptional regulator [Roseomonas acroporae]MCK8787828.1 MarR family transcriptional regulator [Roseomonas acroporae]